RENIAFAMLWWARLSKQDILIDPMCGAGTFCLEAAMIKSNTAPGYFRSFAFESWPGFSHKAFAYMKRQEKEKYIDFPSGQIFSSDIDRSALNSLKQNLAEHDFCKTVNVSKQNFFDINPSILSPEKKGIVMLNPPYGKRIGQKQETGLLYKEIGEKLKSDFKGWRVGIIMPSRESKDLLKLKLELQPIFHGGLDIFAGIGKIR
ncbi:RNA methyltransferase, partial [bacterium]|nr:RNA methyltransferase [bacterium]